MIEGFGSLPPSVSVAPPGPASRWLAEELARFESPNVTYLAEDFPIFWAEAHGSNVRDVDGNVYVDLTSAFAVAAAGHSHPAIVAAVREQAGKLLHGMGDVHPPAIKVELLRKLAAIAPDGLEKTILANSGAEAVEAALKTVMLATGKPRVLAFEGGYHGLTLGALTAAGRADFWNPFARQLGPRAVLVPYPNPYRAGNDDEDDLVQSSLTMIEEALDRNDDIGAVLVEPVQGRGGVVVPPDGWLPALRRICDERGLLLVFDEIYTGFGRTGRWFACEHTGTLPDLLVVGKALTGGMPFAACIGTEKVMGAWPRSSGEALHTSTFLGHPVGCAAALASMRVIDSEGLVERSMLMGQRFRRFLGESIGDHARVGDIRGLGLMVGVELVRDRQGKDADSAMAARVVTSMLRRGYLLLGGGPHGNVLTLSPPLSMDEELLKLTAEALGEVLDAVG